jgi:hypothetical protein
LARRSRALRAPQAKALKWPKRIALAIWELPENALGAMSAIALVATRKVRRVRFQRQRFMIEVAGGTAVSLGLFVFFTSRDDPYLPVDLENADHECVTRCNRACSGRATCCSSICRPRCTRRSPSCTSA